MKKSSKTSLSGEMILSEDTINLLFSLVSTELLKGDEIYEKLHSTMCLPSFFFKRYSQLRVALDELDNFKKHIQKYDKRSKKQ